MMSTSIKGGHSIDAEMNAEPLDTVTSCRLKQSLMYNF